MSSRLIRIWLVPLLLLASEVWALGLGEIRLSSALNEPLSAEIELLSATPEELENLRVRLASLETFQRYDLDRPLFLTQLEFEIVRSGRTDGNLVRVTSTQPITEPFVTFLVEASWSRGRLLREYTLLLDPPTFAPPPSTEATQPITAPTREQPADSGQIQRPQAEPQPAPTPQQRPAVQAPAQAPAEPATETQVRQEPARPEPAQPEPAQPEPAPAAEIPDTVAEPGFDSSAGGEFLVQRGDTLWGITRQVRPDSRLTMNQTMLAIFEANPEAFAGNINMLRAGATLRIPSADDIFRISRGDALAEVVRQNEEWSTGRPFAPSPAPAPAEPADTSPSLTLVPPDEEDDIALTDTSIDTVVEDAAEDPFVDEAADPVEERIRELESMLEDQDALIEIPDTELAALRQELAELRGDPLPVDAGVADPLDDEILVDEDTTPVDETPAEDTTEPVEDTAAPVVSRSEPQESLLDRLLGAITNFWVIIGSALVLAVLVLVWFMRRAGSDDDEEMTRVWGAGDADEIEPGSVASTGRLSALATDDDAILVEESQRAEALYDDEDNFTGDTVVRPISGEADPVLADTLVDSRSNRSLEDTFSSDSAINLDQADPIAEADFHMAYGLYDQAADLVNSALAAEPKRQDLLAKLCEVYFVWGNNDGFVDAASRMRAQVSDESDPEWSKIVIMGQQIAADHELFSGASAEGMSKAVDLSLDGDSAGGELDIDFASEPDNDATEFFDLGAESGSSISDETGQVPIPPDSGTGIDFNLGDDDELDLELAATGEVPAAVEEGTAEDAAIPEAEATAEIDLDELSLDIDSLGDTQTATDVADDSELIDLSAFGDEAAPADEDEAETGGDREIEEADMLAVSATREMLTDDDSADEPGSAEGEEEDATAQIGDDWIDDALAETGSNLEAESSDDDRASESMIFHIDETLAGSVDTPSADDAVDENSSTSELAAFDETDNETVQDPAATGVMPVADDDETAEPGATDVGLNTSLLDATGQTQVLPEDAAVENYRDRETPSLGDEEDTHAGDESGTLMAPTDDEDGEFDFARTEALASDAFNNDMTADDGDDAPELPGGTDLDLDLDDLTAALKVSEVGDTINQSLDDTTAEQQRILADDDFDETGESGVTQSLSADELSHDIHTARTMTEVGTKLDLARAYVDMGDPEGAKSILEEVLEEGDESQRQQAQQLLDTLPS